MGGCSSVPRSSAHLFQLERRINKLNDVYVREAFMDSVNALHKLFRRFDLNNSGSIAQVEFSFVTTAVDDASIAASSSHRESIKKVGKKMAEMQARKKSAMTFTAVDRNKDNRISWEEFDCFLFNQLYFSKTQKAPTGSETTNWTTSESGTNRYVRSSGTSLPLLQSSVADTATDTEKVVKLKKMQATLEIVLDGIVQAFTKAAVEEVDTGPRADTTKTQSHFRMKHLNLKHRTSEGGGKEGVDQKRASGKKLASLVASGTKLMPLDSVESMPGSVE